MSKIGLDLRYWRKSTGGISRYSRNLLSELLKIDQTNQYTAIITPEDDAEFKLTASNLKKLVVPHDYYSYAEQLKLASILKKERFDLVHFSHFSHPIMYRRPFVVTIHDLIQLILPIDGQKKSRLRGAVYKLVVNDCKRARKVIVPSQSSKNDLVSKFGFNGAKIVITPEGAEANFHAHTDREMANVKERLGLPKRYLLFVSRWSSYKGLDRLLEAYQLVKQKQPDVGLVICGKPESGQPEIERLVRVAQQQDKNIITPGFVSDEDLSAIYSAASVYVHPSLYEGFGIMILEAMAAGVPVVTSNVSSLPEVVGDAGLLVDPKNPSDIAQKIEQILSDPEQALRLKNKGLERVKQYSWRKMAEQTLAVYQEVLGNK